MPRASARHLLSIKIDGPNIKPGRIPLTDLVALGESLTKAIERSALSLGGEVLSSKRGRRSRKLTDPCALELVSIGEGSVTLGFERVTKTPKFDEMDPGLQVIKKSLEGLNRITADVEEPLPVGFDIGVLRAWREVGRPIVNKHFTKMAFTLNHRKAPLTVIYDKHSYRKLESYIRVPVTNQRTIMGRLLMADFKDDGPRIRVHPSMGKPIVCYFDDAVREDVYANILHFVEVTGEANLDPHTDEIISIKISDINRLESKEHELEDKLPSGSPLRKGFWSELTLEELAEIQGVKPLLNINEVLGQWPGGEDEGDIAEQIHKWREEEIQKVV